MQVVLAALVAAGFVARTTVAQLPADCQVGDEPLLWKVTYGWTNHAWLLASHRKAVEKVEPLPSSIVQAVDCSDISYFNFACTPGVNGGLGHYLEHCKYYSIGEVGKDSIAYRLSAQQVVYLQQLLESTASVVPFECQGEPADNLRKLAQLVNSTDFRMSIRFVYLQMVRALDSTQCTLDTSSGADGSQGGFEGWIRKQFSTAKPYFGLSDIEDKCQMFTADVSADLKLFNQMHHTVANATWRTMYQQHGLNLAQDLKCGRLQNLAQAKAQLKAGLFAKRNNHVFGRVVEQLQANTNRTLLFALNVAHFVDFPGMPLSLLTMLRQAGYNVTRMGFDGEGCAPSTYVAPGAKELGLCVMPPGRRQPKSCTDFMKGYQVELDMAGPKEELFGRHSVDENGTCAACQSSLVECSCKLRWENTTEFNRICEVFSVDGVRGQVLELDLKRNPDSMRTGVGLAQKTFHAKNQGCYATTCDRRLLEEQALRDWYKSDPDINDGSVELHPLEPPGEVFSWEAFPWFQVAVAAAAVITGCGLCASYMRPPRRKRNVALIPEELETRVPHVTLDEGHEFPRHPPFPIPWDKRHMYDEQETAALQRQLAQDQYSNTPTYDTSLIKQVMRARETLQDAGNQAAAQIQQQTLQSLLPPTSGPFGQQPAASASRLPMFGGAGAGGYTPMSMGGPDGSRPLGSRAQPSSQYWPMTQAAGAAAGRYQQTPTWAGQTMPPASSPAAAYQTLPPTASVAAWSPPLPPPASSPSALYPTLPPSAAPFPRPAASARFPYGGGH